MTFGDRTAEFVAVAESLRARPGVHVTPRMRQPFAAKVSINKAASEIGRETYETAEKLKELTKCTSPQRLSLQANNMV